MRHHIATLLLAFSLLAIVNHLKESVAAAQSTYTLQPVAMIALQAPRDALINSPSADKQSDACTLISRMEVGALQGEPVTDVKSSTQINGRFTVSRCFYTVKTFSKSVSFEVTRSTTGQASRQTLRELWEEKIRRVGGEEDETDKRKRENGNSSALRKLPGIGREAYWVGGGPLGALYVLSDTAYFRISIGGGEPEKNKIVKAKKLAQLAIKRF